VINQDTRILGRVCPGTNRCRPTTLGHARRKYLST
jgi:hypothetical protein